MISSLTRFISESSFSISTRTVLFTAGFPAAFLAGALPPLFAGAALSAFATSVVFASCASSFFASGSFSAGAAASGSEASSALLLSDEPPSNTPPNASAISDTLLMAVIIGASSPSEDMRTLNSNSKFSSSISWVEGFAATTSPNSSIALNTRNALAALSRQFS